MAISAMTVRMDSQIKKQFDSLCQQFGMSSNTAINIFVNQVVRSRSIPFTVSIETPKEDLVRQRALEAIRSAHERAANSSEPELTLDEINEEIRAARHERREREQKQEA